MIIWGSRGLTSTVDSSEFHCPQCAQTRYGNLKQVRTFFTLYFIPLIPLNVAGRYVECESCGGTFAEEALDYDPEAEREEMLNSMLGVMVRAALADGEVDAGERREIEKQFQDLAGLPVPSEKLDRTISAVRNSPRDLNRFVDTLADDLSPHGRALVVKLAFCTMMASGELQPGHREQLSGLADTLGIPQDQYLELIKQLRDPKDVAEV